jgi:hypothetical protein
MSNIDDLEEALCTYCSGEILRHSELTPTEVKYLLGRYLPENRPGFHDLAEEWDSEGFGVVDACEWWMAGCCCAETAAKLRDEGINPKSYIPTKETP